MHDCRLNERGNLLSEGEKKSISSLECALDCLQDNWGILEFYFWA